MDIEIKSRLDNAINSSEPEARLIKFVEQLKQEGWGQLKIYDLLENYMLLLHEAERETEEDIVTEVLSLVYGWCSPNVRLFPHTLSNEEIKEYRETKQSDQLR